MNHEIIIKKARVHNLKGVDLTLKTNELIVFTGVSGSGKSSLAFDTLFVEGQRRYIESLSAYARRYLGDLSKPDVELISGLSPTISIEQKSAGKNPRSTVGTLTEIYDYLRVLFARVGIPHCPVSGEEVSPQSKERIIKKIQSLPEGSKIVLLAPFARNRKGEFKEDLEHFLRKGYMRARVDGAFIELGEELALDKNLTHDIDIVVDRLTVAVENHSRIAEGVMASLEFGNGLLTVFHVDENEETLYSTHAYSPKSGLYYSSLEPHDFSFNSPSGMCPACSGMGITQEFTIEKVIDPEKSIAEDCCSLASSYKTVRYGNIYDNLASLYDFNVRTPWKNLPELAKKIFLYGTEKKWTQMHFTHPSRPLAWTEYVRWRGVLAEAKERFAEAKSEKYRKKLSEVMQEGICSACQGSRLRPYPAATTLAGRTLHQLTAEPIDNLLRFFEKLKLSVSDELIAAELVKEIKERLGFLNAVGLHYLSLERGAPTLSGGEAQRVRLASQVGSGLVGVTYILDEPSIGLHPRDNQKLIATLKRLRDMGNTVIVVEHDEETILEADRVVDFGPGPGKLGGEILANGSVCDLLANSHSLTGRYLSGKEKIAIPEERRKPTGMVLAIRGATHHNLKNVNVQFPLGLFLAVTGVSGSGKSSLITDTLYPALANHLHHADLAVGAHKKIEGIDAIDKVIAIDQSPIGRNPRSNPATYIKIFDEIRTLFSLLPESVARGWGPGRYSFNVREGSCAACQGIGMIRVDMDFLEDQWVACTSCKNRRFDQETLSVVYKGKNIYDVLEMTVEEAAAFFANIPTLKRKLDLVVKVGMGYIQLGQPSTTLSGGEAQRIKLAKELVRPGTGKTFYILDEPTTGLHFHDIKALLGVFQELVSRGNTVLVIEHNMDVVKMADWIIDLGPEGGAAGGKIVAAGTPEELAKEATPTGKAILARISHTFSDGSPTLATDLAPQTDEAVLKPRKRKIIEKREKRGREIDAITIRGAEEHNLKHLDLTIPRNQITICTGPSGSGKSSLAFDTVYAEGQRRYCESLSPYVRQFIQQMPKPKLTQIEGLSPAIAIEQKATAGNPRSTIGTMTEIYDYLRLLFARMGTAYCPETNEPIRAITKEYVVDQILQLPDGSSITLLAPLTLQKGETFEDLKGRLSRQGYLRLRLDGTIFELDGEIPYDRKRKQQIALVIDRIKLSKQMESRLFEGVENATHLANGKVIIMHEEGETLYNLSFAVEKTGKSYPPITPHTFSFNNPEGMCLDCQGLGYQYGANLTQNPEIMHLCCIDLLRMIWRDKVPVFEKFLKKEGIDPHLPLHTLPLAQLQFLLNGSLEEKWIDTKEGFRFRWLGIQPTFAKLGKNGRREIKDPLIPLLDEIECISCLGSRLHPLARNVRIQGQSIASLCKLPIGKAQAFIEALPEDPLLDEVMKQLRGRLAFLQEVGLSYLSLDRRAPTLSNGEAQRIRLARQLGNSLTGVLYVLDEPTIGLHPHDNAKLNGALKKLKELGNTLLMVEHDPQTIALADYLLDFGPGAGEQGGHITARGTLPEIIQNPHSLTGSYLSGRTTVAPPIKRRTWKQTLGIRNAQKHNLKNISFDLPIGVMTCLTGVSGSGKSTLLHEIIRPTVTSLLGSGEPFNKLILINQNPIGHTARADVGTYVEVLPLIRTFYASLAAARTKGLAPAHFSYNHRKGMCTACWGMGYKKVEMLFLPPVKVTCDQCNGLRLNPISLEVVYHGKNFGNLLSMTVEEARLHFELLPKACRIFDTLISVGLGYLTLGQEIATLSGGEAQRMKLSRELAKRGTGKTLYLLDEPTTGLHPDDLKKLLSLLHRLVDKGNTMVIIEHNVDLIKNCDYLIDLGPGAGESGGYIIAQGTPEQVARSPASLTAQYLVPKVSLVKLKSIS